MVLYLFNWRNKKNKINVEFITYATQTVSCIDNVTGWIVFVDSVEKESWFCILLSVWFGTAPK